MDANLVLIGKAKTGDYHSFGELVHRYSHFVYAISLKMLRDFHDAEDLSQEVFVKVWRNLSNLKEPEKFPSWLAALTRHQCLDHLRKKSSQAVEPTEQDTINNFSAIMPLERQVELKLTTWKALESLDDQDRLVIILYFMTGYRLKEISQFLEISLSAVESRIRRAKKKLQKELYDQMAEEFTKNRLEDTFEEEVMWRIVPRIATIEIPVSSISESVKWYSKYIGTKVVFQDDQAAMLHLQGGNCLGVPTLYLVQTEDQSRLHFKNTNTSIKHSSVDFYIQDLERYHDFLESNGVKVTQLNFIPGMDGFGGFGFEDTDSNLLSATNVTHSGQE